MIQPAFASPYLHTLQARARRENLAAHPYWRRLLHDRRDLLGRYQSEIDDPSFFLSPHGRKDPGAELDATLAAFFITSAAGNDEGGWQPAQCRFPARYAWLKEQLHFDASQLPEISCPRYEQWKEQMNPSSLSLVFASYFMNNPASAYGHTFLRLNGKGHTSHERLLDYAVNFAADPESDNGVLFALKGLWGGYQGRFSTFPYYMKVQEYNNLESRDLWEYDLNVSSANLERLLEHLWELGSPQSRYFFINKNCSYYLLPVLEVMDPALSLHQKFIFKTIPIDTVREMIHVPGELESMSYRPSYATKMLAARKRLSKKEVGLAENLVNGSGMMPLKELPLTRQALILDSAYDLFQYRVGFARNQPAPILEKENNLLLWRNQVGIPSPVLEISSSSAISPDQGHKTGRMDLSYGFSNHSHFEELSLRPALHDQDDPPAGYSPGSQLEMFHLKLRYDDNRKTAYVQEFHAVDLISLTPWDRWITSSVVESEHRPVRGQRLEPRPREQFVLRFKCRKRVCRLGAGNGKNSFVRNGTDGRSAGPCL